MGLKVRRGAGRNVLSEMFRDQILAMFIAGAKGQRTRHRTRLGDLENVHGPLPEPLRSFLALDNKLVLDDGIGPWDLVESTDQMAPRTENGNLFEQIVLCDQDQFACNVGLLQIATSSIPIGISDASDLYFVSTGEDSHPVLWFVPEDDGEFVGVIADSLETFGQMALLAKRVTDGDDSDMIRADAETIRSLCTPGWLSSDLSDVLGDNWPDTKTSSRVAHNYDRASPWLYALSPYLRSFGEDDHMCQYNLAERWQVMNHRSDGWQDVYSRAQPEGQLHDAFYWLWRSYFLDESELKGVQRRCLASQRPVIADMARLVAELRGGRRLLGVVDVPQVQMWLQEISECP